MPQHPCWARTTAWCGFPAVASQCLLCLCWSPRRSAVLCTSSCCAHQGQMPTGKRSSRENFLFGIHCFQACQFGRENICESTERAIPDSSKPGEGLLLMLQYTAQVKNCCVFGGNICSSSLRFSPPPCLHAQLLVPSAAQVCGPSQACHHPASPF